MLGARLRGMLGLPFEVEKQSFDMADQPFRLGRIEKSVQDRMEIGLQDLSGGPPLGDHQIDDVSSKRRKVIACRRRIENRIDGSFYLVPLGARNVRQHVADMRMGAKCRVYLER
ncbi:hypothetical protein [Bradyrhizobium cenepequi]